MAANAGASVGLSPVMLFLAVTFVVVTGANDGGAEPGAVAAGGTSALIAASFARGVVLSLRRLAGRLGRDLLVVRPVHALSAELAFAAAVFGSSAAAVTVRALR